MMIRLAFLFQIFPGILWAADLPSKIIQPTLYCSQIQRLDQIEKLTDLGPALKADRIVISKSRRKLYLLNQDRLMKEYRVSFGFGYLNGAKSQSGDGRTPEGLYKIEMKRTRSNYHMALEVSYPNEADQDFAKKYQVSAGGDILIHGLPSSPVDQLDPDLIQKVHGLVNWTQGCIAVTDDEIEEIYSLVEAETPLEICPLETK